MGREAAGKSEKSVLEKLGVKPGLKVALLGDFDPGFRREAERARREGLRPRVHETRAPG